MKRRFLLLVLIKIMFLYDSAFAQLLKHQKLPSFNQNSVQVFENDAFCSVGLGKQQIMFKFDDNYAQSKSVGNIIVPNFDLQQTPYLSLSCRSSSLDVEYSYLYDSIKFEEYTEINRTEYNTIEFKLSTLSISYPFSLVQHYLHLDSGLGYYHIQYVLGVDDVVSSELLTNSGTFFQLNLKLYLNTYLYLNWYNQFALADSSIVNYSNRLGLNFLVKI